MAKTVKVKKKKPLKALGDSAKRNKDLYKFDNPDPTVLEVILYKHKNTSISLIVSGWTGLCPVTGQPDHGRIEIQYEPDGWIVESKSFKVYLMGFRNFGCFGEQVVAKIRDDLVNALDPEHIEVHGYFAARGDVAIEPSAYYTKPLF